MTMKTKTRKAPAAKARAPKLVKQEARAAFCAPFGLQPFALDGNKIAALASRYRWLQADQDYATAIAPREADYDHRHEDEQDRIISELRVLVPKDYFELAALFQFAIDGIRMGPRRDGADFDMLQNIYDAFPLVLRAERES